MIYLGAAPLGFAVGGRSLSETSATVLFEEGFATSNISFTLNTAGGTFFTDTYSDFLGILNGAGTSCFGAFDTCTDNEPTGFSQQYWSGFTKV